MSYNPDHPSDHLSDVERDEVDRLNREFLESLDRPTSPNERGPLILPPAK